MMKALSTKTISPESIAYAHSLNIGIQCIDFIETKSVTVTEGLPTEKFDSVVFTSSNAVKHFFEQAGAIDFLTDKNIFSLAGKTAEELSIHKVTPTLTAKTAEELAEKIISSKQANAILHVCGNMRLDTLEKKLRLSAIQYTPLIVYQTILKQQALTDNNFDAIMFYSPSGVESFFASNKLNPATVTCCIGDTTATALRENHNNILVADEPTPEAMATALSKHFKKQQNKI